MQLISIQGAWMDGDRANRLNYLISWPSETRVTAPMSSDYLIEVMKKDGFPHHFIIDYGLPRRDGSILPKFSQNLHDDSLGEWTVVLAKSTKKIEAKGFETLSDQVTLFYVFSRDHQTHMKLALMNIFSIDQSAATV